MTAMYAIFNLIKVGFPTLATRVIFWRVLHRRLNLSKPKRLDDKIQWLKLNTYRDNTLVMRCADKYLVREYVKSRGCGQILNELIGVWDSPDEIDWNALPDRFVLKCNHGCGYNFLCTDKGAENWQVVKGKLNTWLAEDYWKKRVELQYKSIPKKVICEKFLGDGNSLYDYKFYCFNGKACYAMVCVGREFGWPRFYFYDREWRFCPITKDGISDGDPGIAEPQNFREMIRVADVLASPFPFVRVDLYNVDGKIYFGELTFTPAAGMDENRLEATDYLFGEMLRERAVVSDLKAVEGSS